MKHVEVTYLDRFGFKKTMNGTLCPSSLTIKQHGNNKEITLSDKELIELKVVKPVI